LEAQKFSHHEIFVERAKLFWARDCKCEAITTLEKGIADHFPKLTFGFVDKDTAGQFDANQLAICGKAKLLLAR
jgi:hypothetical protein